VDGQDDEYIWQWTGLVDAQVNGMYVKSAPNTEWQAGQGELVYAVYLNGDATAPTVASVTPTKTTGVSRNTNITATFSEEMDEASVEGAGVFTLKKREASETVDATVTYDPDTKTLTLDPASRLGKGATYTATITTQAQDEAGNALSEQKDWTFKTKRR
jgi:hypothetical protein